MRLMGSGYKKIHVCINNCLLYWKNDKDLTACQTCGTSRWKVDNKTKKVYENIPAKAWRTIDEKFPEIAEDTRNLRLGISADRGRHKQVLKTKNPGKRIAFLENEHSKSFAFLPVVTSGRSGVSVEAIDLHISKEVATTRQAFYYGVLQEIWVLDYRFRQIPLFKCDWVNHRAGGVKRDNLGYTLVDLNNLGHKTPPKNYKDTYDEVDEEFSTVIHQHNDSILPCVNRRDLGTESRDDYYRTDRGDRL
ncbi:hypothetical protein Tco_1539996 [Tanacetum coccineum]